MIKIINESITMAKQDIIIHFVDARGVLDENIARKYPRANEEYINICQKYNNEFEKLRGKVDLTEENKRFIAKIFVKQDDGKLDYAAIEEGILQIRKFAEQERLSVAVPFKIGCEANNGEWEIVQNVINKCFKDNVIYVYKSHLEFLRKKKFIKLPKDENGKLIEEFKDMLGHVYTVYYSEFGEGYVICNAETEEGIKAFKDSEYKSLLAIGESEEFAKACAYEGEDPGMALYFSKDCFEEVSNG